MGNVKIVSITSGEVTVTKWDVLTASTATVQYVLTTMNSADAPSALIDNLKKAISSGALTAAIHSSSPALAALSASEIAIVVDISPTSSPTSSPVTASAKATGDSSTIPIAVGVGVGGFVVALITIVFFLRRMKRRRKTRYSIVTVVVAEN